MKVPTMFQFDVVAALRRHLVRRLTDKLAATKLTENTGNLSYSAGVYTKWRRLYSVNTPQGGTQCGE